MSIQNKENNIKTIKNSYFDMNLQLRSLLVVVGNSRGVKLLVENDCLNFSMY